MPYVPAYSSVGAAGQANLDGASSTGETGTRGVSGLRAPDFFIASSNSCRWGDIATRPPVLFVRPRSLNCAGAVMLPRLSERVAGWRHRSGVVVRERAELAVLTRRKRLRQTSA